MLVRSATAQSIKSAVYTPYCTVFDATKDPALGGWVLQITDEDEIYPEDRVMVLNWGPLSWYDPRVQSWSTGRLLGR